MAIESGIIGWSHVYFEELLASAREYLGEDSVAVHVIDRAGPYVPQFRRNLAATGPTHVVLDVRTPGQTWSRSLIEAWAVSWQLLRHGVVPIVVLTDAFHRRQRWQAAALSPYRGIVVTFASDRIVRRIFPHPRIRGPLVMPISVGRLDWLAEAAIAKQPISPRVQFIGSVYPPRDRFLAVVAERLARRGIRLETNSDKAGTTNEDYWRTLAGADIVLTTTLQGPDRPLMDWIWVQQAVFRFSEALVCNAALVAGTAEGIEQFYEPGIDFLPFVSVDEAVEAIATLANDSTRRQMMVDSGRRKAVALARTHAFWTIIDSTLGPERMAGRSPGSAVGRA